MERILKFLLVFFILLIVVKIFMPIIKFGILIVAVGTILYLLCEKRI